jgi:HAD superfamily hydrolase (TIGR01493 family)
MSITRARVVLFDFAGTLFSSEPDATWVRRAAARAGWPLSDDELANLARRMAAARELPQVVAAQRGADRSARAHRASVMAWLAAAEVRPELARALYTELTDLAMWTPYPDTPTVLGALRDQGIAVGVVSNTGWDIRRHFTAHRLTPLIDAFALSFEHGVEKPDPRLFQIACDALGVDPALALMVGDSPLTDGGAVRLGMGAYLLPRIAGTVTPGEPRGLEVVLRLV